MAARPDALLRGIGYTARLRLMGVPLHSGINPVSINGGEHVRSFTFVDKMGKTQNVDCNAVGMGYHLRAEAQLADLARCNFRYSDQHSQWLPEIDPDGRTSVSGVYMAGDCSRLLGADGAELSGRLAAYAALRDAGMHVSAENVEALHRQLRVQEKFQRGIATAFPLPISNLRSISDDTLICRCDAITVGKLRETVKSGQSPEINRAKALSRVGMGRCQGRYCAIAGAEVVAHMQSSTAMEAGRLRAAAPIKQIPLSTREGSK